jgi:hypothetical protein
LHDEVRIIRIKEHVEEKKIQLVHIENTDCLLIKRLPNIVINKKSKHIDDVYIRESFIRIRVFLFA